MRLVIKDHKCISVCYERGFMCNFHQLKIKAETSVRTKGSALLKRKTVFESRLKSLKKGYFVINLVSTILDKSPWDGTAIFIFFCHFLVTS